MSGTSLPLEICWEDHKKRHSSGIPALNSSRLWRMHRIHRIAQGGHPYFQNVFWGMSLTIERAYKHYITALGEKLAVTVHSFPLAKNVQFLSGFVLVQFPLPALNTGASYCSESATAIVISSCCFPSN